MRAESSIGKRVERKLRREVEILVFAGVHLSREVLHRGNARKERPELTHPHGIGPLEDVVLAKRYLGVWAKRRKTAAA